MKKLLIGIMIISTNCYAGLITHTDYASGGVITASGQNTNENTIYSEFNGNIENVNIKAGAAIAASKLAAMGASQVTFTDGSGYLTTTAGSYSTVSSITVTGTITPTGGLVGNTTTVASAGQYGEFLSSTTSTSNFAASNHFTDLVSTGLTAGDWILSATVVVQRNGSGLTAMQIGITTSAGDSGTGITLGVNRADFDRDASSNNNSWTLVIPVYHVDIGATTTYNLKLFGTYSSGTPQASGILTAIRIR